MKKGFTLIELLAVILILGIIALIAIPTVNNILKEAREGAFRTSSDNIMKSMEEACQTSLIRGDNPVLNYIFTDGKSSSKLEVKGTMPNDGYVFLDRECSVINFYLTDQNNTYTNGEDVRKDYMLKEPIDNNTSIFKSLYSSYYNNLLSINTVNHLNIPEGAIEIKDASVSEAGKIKSWLVQNGSNYDLYIGSEGKIYANYNSAYLFSGSSATSITFDNFYTDFVNNMNSMFYNDNLLIFLDLSNWATNNVINLGAMFEGCSELTTINFDNWNTDSLKYINNIFKNCFKLANINISNWNTKEIVTAAFAFADCYKITSLNLSNWDVSNLLDMKYMFKSCTGLYDLNISTWNTKSSVNSYYMFFNCKSLVSLNLSNWEGKNITTSGFMFSNCSNLEALNIQNWDMTKLSNQESMFNGVNKLNNLIIKNADSINKLSSYLPSKDVVTPGTITIIGDKTGVDTTTLSSKNWNVE